MKRVAINFFVIALTLSSFAQNVGIGTTTPAYKLDVNGNLNINGDNSIYIYGSRFIHNHGVYNVFGGVNSGKQQNTALQNKIDAMK